MSKTVAELIDMGVGLHNEGRRISGAANLLVCALGEDNVEPERVLQLARAIRDTADHCCRVIEGPR